MDPAEVRAGIDTSGEIEVDVGTDGEVKTVVVDADAVAIGTEQQAGSGEEMSVLELDDATVLIYEG